MSRMRDVADILLVGLVRSSIASSGFSCWLWICAFCRKGSGGIGELFLHFIDGRDRFVVLLHPREDQRLGFVGAGDCRAPVRWTCRDRPRLRRSCPDRPEAARGRGRCSASSPARRTASFMSGSRFSRSSSSVARITRALALSGASSPAASTAWPAASLARFMSPSRKDVQLHHHHQRLRLLGIELEALFQIGQGELAELRPAGVGRIGAEDRGGIRSAALRERRGQHLIGEILVRVVQAFLQRAFGQADDFVQIVQRRGRHFLFGGFVQIVLPFVGGEKRRNAGNRNQQESGGKNFVFDGSWQHSEYGRGIVFFTESATGEL